MGKYTHYSTDELQREIDACRKYEHTLVDRMNRYGPDFWHHKLNGVRIRITNMQNTLDKRDKLG